MGHQVILEDFLVLEEWGQDRDSLVQEDLLVLVGLHLALEDHQGPQCMVLCMVTWDHTR